MKRTSFWVLVLKGLVGLHRTIQLQLLQCYWLGHRHYHSLNRTDWILNFIYAFNKYIPDYCQLTLGKLVLASRNAKVRRDNLWKKKKKEHNHIPFHTHKMEKNEKHKNVKLCGECGLTGIVTMLGECYLINNFERPSIIVYISWRYTYHMPSKLTFRHIPYKSSCICIPGHI